MKITITFLFLIAFSVTGIGQGFTLLDTLISENFEIDPTNDMLTFPSGNDLEWVNFDEDHVEGLCVDNAPTPYGWWQESDFSVPQSSQTDNDAFTSCSFLLDGDIHNANWLITSPIMIPDSSYFLCWRSLSFYGPGYHDGYKVLVSTNGNDVFAGSFADTLFVAAEMLENSSPPGSLDIGNYVFSDGYIQANGYTDTAYFFIDYSLGAPFYHGKLEPHVESLSKYAGQNIYVAFLHDSQDDFLLQVDDIIVTKVLPHSSAVGDLSGPIEYLEVMPNPVRQSAYISWRLKTPQETTMLISDGAGRIVRQIHSGARSQGNHFLELQDLAPGVYNCTLLTARGRASTRFVKL